MFCKDPHDYKVDNGFQQCQREKEHVPNANCYSSGEKCHSTLNEGGRSKDGRTGQINDVLGIRISGSCWLMRHRLDRGEVIRSNPQLSCSGSSLNHVAWISRRWGWMRGLQISFSVSWIRGTKIFCLCSILMLKRILKNFDWKPRYFRLYLCLWEYCVNTS